MCDSIQPSLQAWTFRIGNVVKQYEAIADQQQTIPKDGGCKYVGIDCPLGGYAPSAIMPQESKRTTEADDRVVIDGRNGRSATRRLPVMRFIQWRLGSEFRKTVSPFEFGNTVKTDGGISASSIIDDS